MSFSFRGGGAPAHIQICKIVCRYKRVFADLNKLLHLPDWQEALQLYRCYMKQWGGLHNTSKKEIQHTAQQRMLAVPPQL